jgi:enterochelin esterase-like enzyme
MKIILSFVSIIILLLLSGCGSGKIMVDSVSPDMDKLQNSSFYKFVNELKSLPENKRADFLQIYLSENPESPVIEGSDLAAFYWYGVASSVLITGDIQAGWQKPDELEKISCGQMSFYYIIYSLPPDTRVDYQYIVDGNYITDPRNPVITPSGFGQHSQCAMPLFKPDPIREFRDYAAHGELDSLYFTNSTSLLIPRLVKIYKPAGYDSLSALPVLYVNDGIKAIEFNSYTVIIDNLIHDKKIPPMLVVFIEYIPGDQDFFMNRTDEYLNVIADELVPLIDKKYSTNKSAAFRGIAGISAGGHFSLLAAFKRPDIFLKAAGQSSAITQKLYDALYATNPEIRKNIRLYFDVGRFDLINGPYKNAPFHIENEDFSNELKNYNITHTFNIFNDGHEWANWRERVDDILIFLFN